MTTSTLDLIDWDTCLDDEPACESAGCGETAAVRAIANCGHLPARLKCHLCANWMIESLQRLIDTGRGVACATGGHRMYGPTVADIVTVIPL